MLHCNSFTILGAMGLSAVAACSPIVSPNRCDAIALSDYNVTPAGLTATVGGHPITLSGPGFTPQALQKAGQALLILNQVTVYDCQQLVNMQEGPEKTLREQRTDAAIANLATLAIQASQATNDQQLVAAVAAAQNTTIANKTQTAASPHEAAATGAPVPGATNAPVGGGPTPAGTPSPPPGTSTSNIVAPSVAAGAAALAADSVAALHPTAPTSVPALPVAPPGSSP